MNWRGTPLVDVATIVSLIGATRSRAGLHARAELDQGRYPAGLMVTSFFATVKSELADRFGSYNEAKMELFFYLEVYDNQRRSDRGGARRHPRPAPCLVRPPPSACRLATTAARHELIQLTQPVHGIKSSPKTAASGLNSHTTSGAHLPNC